MRFGYGSPVLVAMSAEMLMDEARFDIKPYAWTLTPLPRLVKEQDKTKFGPQSFVVWNQWYW